MEVRDWNNHLEWYSAILQLFEIMKRYIALLTFTAKGFEAIKDSPARADAFRESTRKVGVKINALYWTSGPYDGLISFDAPDEETADALMLSLNSTGKVRTKTMRAHDSAEFSAVLAKAERI